MIRIKILQFSAIGEEMQTGSQGAQYGWICKVYYAADITSEMTHVIGVLVCAPNLVHIHQILDRIPNDIGADDREFISGTLKSLEAELRKNPPSLEAIREVSGRSQNSIRIGEPQPLDREVHSSELDALAEEVLLGNK